GRLGANEIDPALLEIHPHQPYPDAVAEAITPAGALAEELVARRVEVEVVRLQLGHMHQALDIHLVEGDENAERRDTADRSVERPADAVLHVIALEPGFDVARRLVRAALGLRAVLSERTPVPGFVTTAGEGRLDGAMDEQIGIAPDRRGEVRVRL